MAKKRGRRGTAVRAGRYVFYPPYAEGRGRRVRWSFERGWDEPGAGKTARIPLDARSREEALSKWHALIAAEWAPHEEARGAAPSRIRLEDAAALWIERLDLRPATVREYRSVLVGVLLPHLAGRGRVHVASVGFADIEDLILDTLRDRAAATKEKYVAVWKAFLAWCERRAYTRANPVARFRRPRGWGEAIAEARDSTGKALWPEEARRLLRCCRDAGGRRRGGPRDENLLLTAVLIALHTGLRRRNVLEMTWRHLDLPAGIVAFPRKEMKNRRPFRAPLHPELRAHLEALRARRRAGLAIRWHDLRHSFGTWLGEIGPHSVIQQLMGRTPTSMTDRYSPHQRIETLRAWIEKLPNLLDPEEPGAGA